MELHGPAPSTRWPSLLAALLILAAAGLRSLYLALPELNSDMAMWGLLAMDILEGRPHLFFAGELFGGALEAWLAAPLFWLLGPGPLVLCLVPTAFSLALVWLVGRLARQEWGDWPGLAAMAWTALSPWFLTQHSWQPLGAYIEAPLLAAAALALSLRLTREWQAAPGAGPGSVSLCLGLVCGLGLWTHLLMLPAIAACGLYLLLVRPGLVFSRQGLFMLIGLAAGGLPLWVISVPGGLLNEEVLRAGRQLQLGPAWAGFWSQGLPTVLGLMEPRHLGESWPWARLAVWGLYGLVLAAALWPARGPALARPPRPGGLLGLCLLYLALYLAVWLFSGAYSQSTWRHLTPLYAALPLVFGAAVAKLRRWGPGPPVALAALVLGLNLWGSLTLAPLLNPMYRLVHQDRRQGEQTLFSRLEREGRPHVYSQWFWDALPLTLNSGGRITFADQAQNHLPHLTRLADRAAKPAYVITTRDIDFENTLAAAGIAAQRKDVAQFKLFRNFRSTWPALKAVEPRGWTSPQADAAEAWDRDLATAWTLDQPQREGQALIVDLGRMVEDLCLVQIMPGPFHDAAGGLALELSQDGATWAKAASQEGTAFAPLFWSLDRPLIRFLPARQQLAFNPRPARLLRLTQTGQSSSRWWSVAELFVYQAAGPAPATPSPLELARAIQALPARGLVYAPPQVLALLPPSRAGFCDPQLPDEDAFPLGRLALSLRPDTVLCLPAANWPASLEALAGLLDSPPQVVTLGDQVLVHGLMPAHQRQTTAPLPAGARVKASHRDDLAGLAGDGSARTRWHPGVPQAPGQELRIDLGREMDLAGVSLETGPWVRDQPRGLTVLVSQDGVDWQRPEDLGVAPGGLVWGGDRVLAGGGGIEARFAPRPVRHLRLVLTGEHPRLHWSVAEVKLLVPAP